jgi:hypothetical protein
MRAKSLEFIYSRLNAHCQVAFMGFFGQSLGKMTEVGQTHRLSNACAKKVWGWRRGHRTRKDWQSGCPFLSLAPPFLTFSPVEKSIWPVRKGPFTRAMPLYSEPPSSSIDCSAFVRQDSGEG